MVIHGEKLGQKPATTDALLQKEQKYGADATPATKDGSFNSGSDAIDAGVNPLHQGPAVLERPLEPGSRNLPLKAATVKEAGQTSSRKSGVPGLDALTQILNTAGVASAQLGMIRAALGKPKSPAAGARMWTSFADKLVRALDPDAPPGAGKELIQETLTQPTRLRDRLLHRSAAELAAGPIHEALQAAILHAQTALASSRAPLGALEIQVLFGGNVPAAALTAAATLGLGDPLSDQTPRAVDDSRFIRAYDFAFEGGTLRVTADGRLHLATVPVDGRPVELPADLLPLCQDGRLQLQPGDHVPEVAADLPPGEKKAAADSLENCVKVARNLGSGLDLSAPAIALGRQLLSQSWMAKEGILAAEDAFILPLKAKGDEPPRYLYRTRAGQAWRPVPDTEHPLYYRGPATLGRDGQPIDDPEQLPRWAKSMPERILDMKIVAQANVLGVTGPGESLPVTHTYGTPETRDFMIYSRTAGGSCLGLAIRRGDIGAYALAGGFVDAEELKEIKRAEAELAALPADAPAKTRKDLEANLRSALFAAALRELMEEAFGKANREHPTILALGKEFDAALVDGKLKQEFQGDVEGDFRRTTSANMHTRFVSMEVPVELFRQLELLAAGSDDAKFAGSVMLLDGGKPGPLINRLDMPYHFNIVEPFVSRLQSEA